MSIDVRSLHGRRADDRWNRTSIGDLLERVTWSEPDKVVLIAAPDAIEDPQFTRVTYAQADRITNQVANALRSKGLQRSDRVAMFCENSVEAYLAKLGIAKAGLVVVPINVMMAPDVVEHMLRHVEARLAIVDASLRSVIGPVFEAAGVPIVAMIGEGDAVPSDSTGFAEFIADAPASEPEVEIHGDDIWEILLTSGTTAMPKAVMISHTYSYMAALSYALTYTRGLEHESDVRLGTFLPIVYHVGDHAFVLSALMCGGSVVLGRRPEGHAMARAVTRERITGLWGGSPQLLQEFARAVDADPMAFDVSSLTVIMYGWASVSPGLLAALQRQCGGHVRLVGLFGQTEAIACHRFRPDRWPDLYRRTAPEVNYVGLPNPLLASTVVDPEGTSLRDRPGVAGEAVYRSPVVTAGYYLNEEATREALRDGWFHSGDSCMFDEDGLRIMVDRYKDIVKSGGENVSSLRVEAVLLQHPAVAAAAVVGVPDERWGEAVTGVVTLGEQQRAGEEELMSFCRERLAGYEAPKRIVFMEQLPTTVGGKVLKYRLRESLSSR